jgi:hypothetical protein
MINQYELEQTGLSVDGVALRLEGETHYDFLAEYRRRRNLSDLDAVEYVAGVEIGAAWVREEASAAALAAAWWIAEHGGPWTALRDLDTSLRRFLTREADESRRETRFARFSPEMHSWDDESPFIAGIIDVAGAAWAALRARSGASGRACQTLCASEPRAASLEDETGDRSSRAGS